MARKGESAWSSVDIQSEVPPADTHIRVGDRLPVTALVRLGSLSPDDVRVEVVYGLLDTQSQIASPATAVMQPVSQRNGQMVYKAEPDFVQSGQYGFAVRVLPHHPDTLHALTPQW